ncbi:hypothetical protein [Methylomonas koyamae]|uniref:hypothetical protein n=1 Tax=Methylomonas koyamae TaxID=702114 RepID=UPI0006D04EDF|nr:hypothetical protein [Methylomonas koyamae]
MRKRHKYWPESAKCHVLICRAAAQGGFESRDCPRFFWPKFERAHKYLAAFRPVLGPRLRNAGLNRNTRGGIVRQNIGALLKNRSDASMSAGRPQIKLSSLEDLDLTEKIYVEEMPSLQPRQRHRRFCTLHGKARVTMKPVIDFKSTAIQEPKVQKSASDQEAL